MKKCIGLFDWLITCCLKESIQIYEQVKNAAVTLSVANFDCSVFILFLF